MVFDKGMKNADLCGGGTFLSAAGHDSDVSSPHTADRGPSRVEGSKGIVPTNQGPSSGSASQWEEGTRDAYLMPSPPPPTLHRNLTGGRREEGVGGTYLADPGGGSCWKDL